MTDAADIAAEATENGTAQPYIRVPFPLAQRMLDILAQLPYGQVADVVNEFRALEVEEGQ